MKRRKWWLLGAAGLLVVWLVILQLRPEGTDELRASYDRLSIGMDWTQVQQLLGKHHFWSTQPPSTSVHHSDHGDLYLSYDSQGKLVAKEYRTGARLVANWITRLRQFLGI